MMNGVIGSDKRGLRSNCLVRQRAGVIGFPNRFSPPVSLFLSSSVKKSDRTYVKARVERLAQVLCCYDTAMVTKPIG
jgi:hypothetical protein